MKNSIYARGAVLTLVGAFFWGISGTCGQFLFEQKMFNAQWLVTVRLLIAGFLILVLCYSKQGKKIFYPWLNKKDAIELLLFSILGMLAIQYTYFVAIQYSNAPTATVLQYLGPVFIMGYLSFKYKKKPGKMELAAIICAITGIFILVTHGNINSLNISKEALIWGLLSAICMAYYSIQPARILNKWGSLIVIGWGMLVGGIAISFVQSPFDTQGIWDASSVAVLLIIIVFGTLIAFSFYLEGIKTIGATDASLFACVEPLSAAVFSVVWLKTSFGLLDWIGSIFIVSTIFLLTLKGSGNKAVSGS